MMRDDPSQPLVSCIMPTYNRRLFVPKAIEYFLRQDYVNKELVIIDDGTDAVRDLVPEDSHLRYLRLDKKHTTGAKRDWLAGGSLLYTRDFWQRSPFPNIQVASDTRFIK